MSRINDAVQRCAEALEVWKQGGIPFDVVRGCFAHARQNGSPAVQTQLDELYQRHLEGRETRPSAIVRLWWRPARRSTRPSKSSTAMAMRRASLRPAWES